MVNFSGLNVSNARLEMLHRSLTYFNPKYSCLASIPLFLNSGFRWTDIWNHLINNKRRGQNILIFFICINNNCFLYILSSIEILHLTRFKHSSSLINFQIKSPPREIAACVYVNLFTAKWTKNTIDLTENNI